METPPSGYVSVIAGALFWPLVDLIAALSSTGAVPPNEVQTGQIENGYSLSIILLTVVIMESAARRTAYIRKEDIRGPVPEYLAGVLKDGELAQDVEEIFVVRNVIAHNHIWEGEILWNDAGMDFHKSPERDGKSGDKKYRRVIDEKERVTRRLRLNLFPPRIWRKDAWAVMGVMWKAILELEKQERNYIYLSPVHYKVGKEFKTFDGILKGLKLPTTS